MKGAERAFLCQDQSRVFPAGGVIRVIESWIISIGTTDKIDFQRERKLFDDCYLTITLVLEGLKI